LCLDIGVSVVDYTEVLLSSTTAKIISFKPLPSSFAALKRVADRFPGGCVLVNKGVGDVDAKLELNYESEESRLASFSKEVNNVPYVGAHNTRSVVVDVIKVDTFWKESAPVGFERIDLIKIDTEGYEYEVILGASTRNSARPTSSRSCRSATWKSAIKTIMADRWKCRIATSPDRYRLRR